jgi:uncharacterized membrane protein
MFGFLFGIACCFGVYWVWRGGGRRRGGRGFRRRFVERAVFERLDASPGQERVIGEAFESVAHSLRELQLEFGRSRHELARELREERFDEQSFAEVFARQDGALGAVRKQVTSALGRVHEALDRSQRLRLAELLETGPRPHWGGRRGWA